MAFKDLIKAFLLDRGLFISRATSVGDIAFLLRLLRPVTTDKGMVRIGGDADGGYLLPDDFEGIRYCFSPGVADNCTFESALSERGIMSFMVDYSVACPPTPSAAFHFERRYLGAHNDEIFITLTNWVQKSVPEDSGDLILQMDIEGAEYEVIFDTPAHVWKRFRSVIIELHDLNTLHSEMGLRYISLCMKKLLEVFAVVHIHPNNYSGSSKLGALEIPKTIEITFLRKDRINTHEYTKVFPHPLDRPNNPAKPDLILPECWYL